jgi:hypothetical protein
MGQAFTSLPKEGVLLDFFALKNPTASVGFEPANLGTKDQHATSRPPKWLTGYLLSFDCLNVLVTRRNTSVSHPEAPTGCHSCVSRVSQGDSSRPTGPSPHVQLS